MTSDITCIVVLCNILVVFAPLYVCLCLSDFKTLITVLYFLFTVDNTIIEQGGNSLYLSPFHPTIHPLTNQCFAYEFYLNPS